MENKVSIFTENDLIHYANMYNEKQISNNYNLLYKEVMLRLNSLYSDNNTENKEVLND